MDVETLLQFAENFHSTDFATSSVAKSKLREVLSPTALGRMCGDEQASVVLEKLLAKVASQDGSSSPDMVRFVCDQLTTFFESSEAHDALSRDIPNTGLDAMVKFMKESIGGELDVAVAASSAIAATIKTILLVPTTAAAKNPIALLNSIEDPLILLRLFKEKREKKVNQSVIAFAMDHSTIGERLLNHAASTAAQDPLEFVNILMVVDIIATERGLESLPQQLTAIVGNMLGTVGGDVERDIMVTMAYPFVVRSIGSMVAEHNANAKFAATCGWLSSLMKDLCAASDPSEQVALLDALAGILSTSNGSDAVAKSESIGSTLQSLMKKGQSEARICVLEALAAFTNGHQLSAAELLYPPTAVVESILPLKTSPTPEVRRAVWLAVHTLLVVFGDSSYFKMTAGQLCVFLTTAPQNVEPEPSVREVQLKTIDALKRSALTKPFHEKLDIEKKKGLYQPGEGAMQVGEEAM